MLKNSQFNETIQFFIFICLFLFFTTISFIYHYLLTNQLERNKHIF